MGTLEIQEEKRFAVVMYGGVSLAIYIHGVAQELLQLVRSTADPAAGPSTGTGRVYREIAEELKAKFIVDILAGTSAGGINAVFLAKALANNQPLGLLECMWLDEGDIEKLINDRRSALDGLKTGFAAPRSLLNSRRMYRKLLEAFDRMDREHPSPPLDGPPGPSSPVCAEEIDLFVTATDLQGVRTPISLTDKVVFEYRHRNVFHFRKSREEQLNDFGKPDNPFLAFACRCTSSFPFAFEPMRLKDTEMGGPDAKKWERFYRDYLLDADRIDPGVIDNHPEIQPNAEGKFNVFTHRAFADGGYLDNKPFSYAVKAIASRQSLVPVDRKLLYVEPSPQAVRDELTILDPPNAFENALKAFSLAQYETIREDLQEIKARNRLMERVGRILDGTLQDIQGNPEKRKPESVGKWLQSDLQEMIANEGIAYGGYLRLRVSRLTDDLAEIITRQAGCKAGSDVFRAVHELVRAWRDRRYCYYPDAGERRENFNAYLRDFNLRFFIQRLKFTVANIDRLFRTAHEGEYRIGVGADPAEAGNPPQVAAAWMKRAKEGPEFRSRLTQIRGELSKRLEEVLKLRRRLMSPAEGSRLTRAVRGMGLTPRRLVDCVLNQSSAEGIRAAAEKLLDENLSAFAEIAGIIQEVVQHADRHSDICKQTVGLGRLTKIGEPEVSPADLAEELDHFLAGTGGPEPKITLEGHELSTKVPLDAAGAAAWAAAFYFRRFPHYDIVAFPLIQAYDIGEELDPVEIIRISPEDADSLSPAGTRKLAGATLMNFGAFLDRTWRKNDILWGRLDGAERIISALVTGTRLEARKSRFIRDAQAAILTETFLGKNESNDPCQGKNGGREKLDLLVSCLLGNTQEEKAAAHAKMAKLLGAKQLEKLLEGVVKGNLDLATVEGLFRNYEADRKLEPGRALRAISRSVQVVGRMLEATAQELSAGGIGKRAGAWMIRIGRLLWGLVEVATPHSLARLFFHHWLLLALIIALSLALFGGVLQDGGAVQGFGVRLLIFVVTAYGVWSLFQTVLLGRLRRVGVIVKALSTAVVFAFLVLAAVGGVFIKDAFRMILEWVAGFGSR